MGLLTFKGGIHPNDGKSLAKDQPIMELLPKGDSDRKQCGLYRDRE